jgi:hypothetical protein
LPGNGPPSKTIITLIPKFWILAMRFMQSATYL